MTTDQAATLLIRGSIASMPEEFQNQVKQAKDEINQIILKYTDAGMMAVALIGAELAEKC